MAKSLVIVESPAKAKTINKFLGSRYVVKPTGGHVIDLPEKEFGININNEFTPKYTILKDKKKILEDLKKAAKEADSVYLATDPDREGEAIAWHIAQRIVKANQPSWRILINQITKDAVKEAIENKGSLDLNKVDAQQARRVLDRMVGYKVSPVLWKALYKGLSAGRVQSVALRLIVERDRKIEDFVPEEYWRIKALLATDKDEKFTAKLLKKDNRNIVVKKSDEAQSIVNELENQNFLVGSVSKKDSPRKPSPPFITSTLQQEASRRLGFTIHKTMRIAQSLYEGIELKDGAVGLITYMRTDSTRVAPEAVQAAREYISGKWGDEHVPSKPNMYKSAKAAQDAHEAIRPSSMEYDPASVKSYLTPEQFKIYSLIWNRFIASQMKPAVYSVVVVDVNAGPYLLRADSKQLKYSGFLLVYNDVKVEGDEEEDENGTQVLPLLKKNDSLKLLETVPSQHFTMPPSYFTEASLVKELESLGIGRPSTYAQIINTIQTRKYVSREKNKLLSTELGRNVNDILVVQFPELFSVGFTASMEEKLDRVESGDDSWVEVVRAFWDPFSETLENVKLKSGKLKEDLTEKTDEVCEKCGKPMIIRWGRNGKFMACSGYPECRNTKPLGEPETTDEVCEKCNAPMEVKTGRYGKFLACSRYPDCKSIRPLPLGVKCPEEGCTGDIVEKKTGKGRTFYSCSRYPECRFANWNKPVSKSCPTCGSPSLFDNRKGYVCHRCKGKFDKEQLK